MLTHPRRRSMAVVGGGVAGLVAAWQLQKHHQVTLYEKAPSLGGHTRTVVVDDPDGPLGIDTGFIAFNSRTYPNFVAWMAELGVPCQDSCMSFSFTCLESGLTFSGLGLRGLLARPRNAVSSDFWSMLVDLARFDLQAPRDVHSGVLQQCTMRDYLARHRYGRPFIDNYIVPLGAAIWSTAPGRMLEFPAETFVRFFDNHGLLTPTYPVQWRTVSGGSHSYLKAFEKQFAGTVRTSAAVRQVRRTETGVVVSFDEGPEQVHDGVVLATHADQSLELLADASALESELLGAWSYETNVALLHRDASAMPPNRRAWASWNYIRYPDRRGARPVFLTYNMNRLQRLATSRQYCVTLNPEREVGSILSTHSYTHPQYTMTAYRSQPRLHELQGRRNTWFCGSYFGFGFHEDAVLSAIQVAAQVGVPV